MVTFQSLDVAPFSVGADVFVDSSLVEMPITAPFPLQ